MQKHFCDSCKNELAETDRKKTGSAIALSQLPIKNDTYTIAVALLVIPRASTNAGDLVAYMGQGEGARLSRAGAPPLELCSTCLIKALEHSLAEFKRKQQRQHTQIASENARQSWNYEDE